ncbi:MULTISPECIES: hypothetical protein [Microbacterium]|jgi:hypothetical protein|uniref:hypothetical protein n=1 Tax=Microbacterium TaxID=33882 RepID=UPI001D17AA28|nr:hypothetical protein [Microbacterium testaceum]MCC4248011.1 hypothetical protein [Microbacterium testaceum]
MSARAGRARRAGRGVSAAVLATFVATLSHSVAAGDLPAMLNVVLALSLASPLCIALVGRTASWWRLTAAIATSQMLFHSLLALDLSGSRGTATAASHHGGTVALAEVAASGHAHALTGTESPWMWAAHAFAAAITVLALGSGERALRAVAGLLSDTFRALVPVSAPRPLAVPRVRPETPLLTACMTVLSGMRHRGPPLPA